MKKIFTKKPELLGNLLWCGSPLTGLLVLGARFERATPRFSVWCYYQLSYPSIY